MKILTTLFVASLVFVACNNKSDQPAPVDDTTTVEPDIYSWQATLNDSTGKLEMKKLENAGPDTLSATAVVTWLNTVNSNIKLELSKTLHDTIYINIPDAAYLTQQMGSTGPTMYFASVVYNLTDIPGINYVTFNFDEGDHASPGTYSRNSFNDE